MFEIRAAILRNMDVCLYLGLGALFPRIVVVGQAFCPRLCKSLYPVPRPISSQWSGTACDPSRFYSTDIGRGEGETKPLGKR